MVHGLRGGRFDQILRWVRQLNCDCAFIALLAIEVGDASTNTEHFDDEYDENSEEKSAKTIRKSTNFIEKLQTFVKIS